MYCKELHFKMENVFISLGIKQIEINSENFFMRNNCFCKLTYLSSLFAFVIEYSEKYQEAENGILEDGDLYFTNTPEDQLLNKLKNDLSVYY